jgi:hypothetical protein
MKARCSGAAAGPRSRGVLLERDETLGPRFEHRRDNPPGFLGLVAAHGHGTPARQDVEQYAP